MPAGMGSRSASMKTAAAVESAATAMVTATTAETAAAATAAAMSSASGSWHSHYLLLLFFVASLYPILYPISRVWANSTQNVYIFQPPCYNRSKGGTAMNRTPVTVDTQQFPDFVRPLLAGAAVYDSSCSNAARVWFLDRDGGYYLKSAAKGELRQEAELTRFFHGRGLAARVEAYESGETDWLLTRRIPGEDCTHPAHLAQPERLCDTVAELLRTLHDTPVSPSLPDRRAEALASAERNYRSGSFDRSHFPDSWGFATPEDAWRTVSENGRCLKSDTVIHGDYCLPNILLDDWRFSGFIDLGGAGLGDRHMDLFWGIWSLGYNLRTDRYRERFLDAYGRDRVNSDALRTVAAMEVFG